MAVPEFLVRKLYVPGSLAVTGDGFAFVLRNTFAPAAVQSLTVEVDGKPVPPSSVSLTLGEGRARSADSLSEAAPLLFAVGIDLRVDVHGVAIRPRTLRLSAVTREVGEIAASLPLREKESRPEAAGSRPRRRWINLPIAASAEIRCEEVTGEIDPRVYGHFIEHLERCVYGGVWTENGQRLRPDTLNLIRELHPTLIRYPGGNFASGYHWEDGIGPWELRPVRFDQAWQASESNRVGTDEFIQFCRDVGAEPFLVVNDGSGTPEEAARWVGYCNDPLTTPQGARRAANGHLAPYRVRLWGVGNEVWGPWQIGHAPAESYVRRLTAFAAAMRAADPGLQIVAVGNGPLSDSPDDPAARWNEAVLRTAATSFDYLSFHIYQPEKEGWGAPLDEETLHHILTAAPLDVEAIIGRMAAQIRSISPRRTIRVALDEWNVWPTPPEGAATMHRVTYTVRDALYVAGMLNVFHRTSRDLAIANLAQLVNVLPLIVTDADRAIPTAIYFPFLLYRSMQRLALDVRVDGPLFESPGLANISARRGVPYVDLTATRDEENRRMTVALLNRHPARPARVTVRISDREKWSATGAKLLAGQRPLEANTLAAPGRVGLRDVVVPAVQGDRFICALPAASLTVVTLAAT